ncbi:MAG: hypothetical protein IKD40_01845 [Bacteroidaceae bacterium]|nr:hypothetical protein [Bacteroidaceae bacterium]MBR4046249.1 hypothetical protein [Alistipes sp.]
MKRLFLSMMVLLQGVAVCLGQNIPVLHNEEVESRNEYRDGNNYQKDLLLYVDMLKATHPYYADTKHCAQLDKQTRKLYKECGGIDNDMDFKVCLAKLAASLGDGHTSVPFWMTFNKVFPVRFAFNNNSAIVDVSPEDNKEILGKEIKRINGKSVKQILQMARPLVSADNNAQFENTVKEYLMFADFWPLLGISNEVMHLDFTDGSSADITAVDKQNLKISQRQQNSSGRITSKRNTLFDYAIYEEESICYLQFNQFADRLTLPQYTQLARFDEFTRDMMAEIKAKGIKTLVVDLQYNSGGNSQLGDVLLSWLYPHQETRQYDVDVRVSELLCTFYPYYRKFTVGGKPLKIGQIYDYMGFDHSKDYQTDYSAPQDPAKHIFNYDGEQIFGGNVVFIQSKDSFSSTILLLTIARDNGIGIIVGEPSGGKPCHYGDVLYAQLPNTNTLATVSHKYFRRPNMALENKECIVPDVSIELNHPERDLVWEWIVENYGKRRE